MCNNHADVLINYYLAIPCPGLEVKTQKFVQVHPVFVVIDVNILLWLRLSWTDIFTSYSSATHCLLPLVKITSSLAWTLVDTQYVEDSLISFLFTSFLKIITHKQIVYNLSYPKFRKNRHVLMEKKLSIDNKGQVYFRKFPPPLKHSFNY